MCQTNAQSLLNIHQEPSLITLRLIRLTPIILGLHRPAKREVLRHGRNEETRRALLKDSRRVVDSGRREVSR